MDRPVNLFPELCAASVDNGWVPLERVTEKLSLVADWDESTWRHFAGHNIIQLHGRCSLPKTMILPTETTASLVLDFLVGNHTSDSIQNRLDQDDVARRSLSRCDSDAFLELIDVHKRAIEWLENAAEIVVWGLAFNNHDAELLTVIHAALGSSGRDRKLTVIDPNPQVRYRAAALFRVPSEQR